MTEQIRFYESLQNPQEPMEQPKPATPQDRNPDYYYCLFYPDCPCLFASPDDQKAHMNKYAWDRQSHLIHWYDSMKRREAGIE
jgi:hypothetical protein